MLARCFALICGLAVAAAPVGARAGEPAATDAPEPVPSASPPDLVAPDPVAAEPAPRPRRGLGLWISGVPLAVLGVVGVGFGGAYFYQELPSVCAEPPCGPPSYSPSALGVSVLSTGLVLLGSGAAMIAVGAVRHHRYRRWSAAQTGRLWLPRFARSQHGTWLVGVGLRF